MSAFEDSDGETDFKEISSTNYQRVQEKVAKISYADGIADGREKVFQDSFDEGFENGFKTGFELAKLSAFYEIMKNAQAETENIELRAEQEAYYQHKLADATDKAHFKYLEHQGESLNVISNKQRIYVDDLLGTLAQQLPATTNLFTSSSSGSSVNVV
ncbi:uncharacterized protein LOC108024772 [Drosophila biarmipes]|uniref:uncharacterized protein LOC108024772 n=1 Tax=Drosophila biarmipes TaxID=125945 RepID=UPI0007E78290|nr:uncharacterized protein LOC108024772 [Drosophila biarmipes]